LSNANSLNVSDAPWIQARIAWLCLLLLAVVAALYGQFLNNPIVFDDLGLFILDNDGNQTVSSFHYSLFQLRSLPYASLAWTKAWFGLDLVNFRLGNLLLHAGVVLGLFFLLLKLFQTSLDAGETAGLSPRLAAFFAALLFAVHPVATYAVGYLVQRSILMATLFSLLTMLLYVHGSLRQKTWLLWLCVPAYFLAVTSKEHVILLPATLVALTVLLHQDWPAQLRQRWLQFVCLAAVALFAILARKELLGSVYEVTGTELLRQISSERAYPLSVLTQCWLFFKYALMWLLPNPAWMSIDMREPFAQSLFSAYLIAALSFAAWGVGACWLLLQRGKSGLLGFALLFPWLMFFTEFSSVRIQEAFVLYRSYPWAVGALCLLPLLFLQLNKRLACLILGIIALTMFALSMGRLLTMSHPVLLWNDAEKLVRDHLELPGVSRIYYNRGTEMIHIGDLDRAISDLKQSISLSPGVPEAHGNLGAAYFQKKDWANAVASFTVSIETSQIQGKPAIARYVHGRAQAYEYLGQLQKAQQDYQESCRLANRGCEKLSPITPISPASAPQSPSLSPAHHD
jgi:tetratricopeptide (TPR) repeat protein